MGRLAEYFCVVGVEDKSDLYDQKELKGCVLQKFPENDWKSSPCPQGLEHFCQPAGWNCTKQKQAPTFFVAILTDVEGKASYLACLTFLETIQQESVTPNGVIEPANAAKPAEKSYNIYHVPTCLCIVSRQKHFTTLKNCLTTIFHAYLNGNKELVEKLIGTMLGFVHVPPPGGSDIKFSLGGGDEQVLQPPLSADLPNTNDCVAVLFNQLGVYTIINVFNALITECKILLLSSSYTHLTMAAEALTSLLYPMKFNYVFIPILPSSLLDFLTAPTPFLMGVHTAYQHKAPELFDVVTVNIDEGCVTIPESIHLVPIPEPYYSCVLKSLKMLLTPSIFTSDYLIPSEETLPSLTLQDKELRAVFIKLFADMFCGYRSCLTLIRVYPNPVISFNKMSFMEKRGFNNEDFYNKVFDSVSFSSMAQKRGPPYRIVDMFDELIAKVDPPEKEKDIRELLADLLPIVDHLCENEPWFDNPEVNTIPSVTPDMLRKPLKSFPSLNLKKINSLIREKPHDKTYQARSIPPRQVPISTHDHPVPHFINQRRLEVLQDCIQYIYENKISEARKTLPSVLRALKSKGAQLALCNELELRVKNESATLEHDQYNLIVRLINAALQDDNTMNSIVVAAKLVPLAAAFHRKLGPSVSQFAYTSIQDHSIWGNMQFWEEAFYTEVQRQIVELHVKEKQKKLNQTKKDEKEDKNVNSTKANNLTLVNNVNTESILTTSNRNSLIAPATPVGRSSRLTNAKVDSYEEHAEDENTTKEMPDAMKLAAELLSEWEDKSDKERERLIDAEESIIVSLIMLYGHRMMELRVPTNACTEMRKIQMARQKEYEKRKMQQAGESPQNSLGAPHDDSASIFGKRSNYGGTADGASTYMGGSIMDGSSGWGSQHDLTDLGLYCESVKDTTSKFILRFVERVCIEAGVSAAHLKSLQQNIPKLVGMHIESLEEVYRETKDAPKLKVKILKPALLHEETIHVDGLRCYLIADGRELGVRTEESLPTNLNETNDEEREINIGTDIGGPCLLPAEGALFLTNYRVIFKGTPVDQFASEMTVTRSFPIGALVKEKKSNTPIIIRPGITGTTILQLRSSTMQIIKVAFDEEEVSVESIESFRKGFCRSRWPQSVYNTFAFNYKAAPRLQRTLSQRQQSIRKTHRSLSSVVQFKKMVAGRESLKGPQKVAIAEDKTARKYTPVNKHSEDDDNNMQQVILERENRGADRLSKSALCMDYERLELGAVSKVSSSGWRLSMLNFHYNGCRGYPAVLVVPTRISDDQILKVAKNYRLNRFPVAVWKHKKTKGTLLRSGAINRAVLSAVLKTELGGKRSQGTLSVNINDDEKFFTEIVNATHLYAFKGKTQTVSAGAALSVQAMSNDFATLLEGSDNYQQLLDEKAEIKNWKPAHLYIFTDRSSSKGTKLESSGRIVVVNVDIHDVQQVKTSFLKLMKVSNPSKPSLERKFLSAVEESKWMQQISSLLQVACSIVNLIDIQGSSCLVSFGDGSEVTAQVVSLVQILSDPFYRTIEGFKVLIEKDWLAFGYRFSHRGNHVYPVQQSIAPFFLQFLDCVYQVICQYRHAFEYNNYFLKFIAYHQTSMRFNTFFLDSEHERYQHGWFPDSEIVRNPLSFENKASSTKSNSGRQNNIKAEQFAQQQLEQQKKKSTSVSLWDYLEDQSRKFTLFNSFTYHPNISKAILQPFCNVSNLEIWDYYTAENLYTGPTYDLELIADFDIASPGNEPAANVPQDVEREDSQRCFTGCYGNTFEFPRDEASYLLYELSRLKEELDQRSRNWRSTWDDLDIRDLLKRKSRQLNWLDFWGRERRIALQKRTTLDMVLKGKVTDASQVRSEFGFELPHDFLYHNYIMTSICNYCLQGISGLHGGLQCSQCGYNTHEKCQSMVPSQCSKHPSIAEDNDPEISRGNQSHFELERSNARNYQGTLYKRGHLLRQWKARWFVLDAEKNRLTYYNSEEDTQLQGYIDLGEVRATLLKNAPPGAPKGDSRTYFELETTKRTYYLSAAQQVTAKEWVERFNALNV